MNNLLNDYFESLDRNDEEVWTREVEETDFRLECMQEELEGLQEMSEEDACICYNTNSKEEARQGIIEYWTFIA